MRGLPSAEQRAATIALLAEWSIDASRVAADSWDAGGYDEFPRNPNTSRESKMIDPATGTAKRIRCNWPKGFPIEELIAIRGGEGR